MGNMALLEVANVVAGYGDTEILRGVSMEVREGEIVSIIGPNGAGKSTLMKTIFGLLHPRQGTIAFEGNDISALHPYQIVERGMCYVPQVANVFTELTVAENLEMGAFLADRRDVAARKERIYAVLPAAQGAAQPARRQDVGRRAADGRHGQRADARAAARADGRALGGAVAEDGRHDLRADREDQRSRARRS